MAQAAAAETANPDLAVVEPTETFEKGSGSDAIIAGDGHGPIEPAFKTRRSWRDHLFTEQIDVDKADAPLLIYCILSGYGDAITYSAAFTWASFQTGNTVILAVAVARLFEPGQTDRSFRITDRQAFTSLVAFNIGSFLGRYGRYFGKGYKTRGWLVTSSLVMTLLSLISTCVTIGANERPIAESIEFVSWTDVKGFVSLAFLSAASGLQAATASKLASSYATTAVITSVYAAVTTNHDLFKTAVVPVRERQIACIACFFIGGLVGRAVLQTIGDSAGALGFGADLTPTALGIGCGLRLITVFLWLIIPSKS